MPKRGEPSAFEPGSDVAIPTPGATTSGFTRPSKASPRDENVRRAPRLAFVCTRERPDRRALPSRRRASQRSRAARPRARSPTTGTGTPSSRPSEPPAGPVAVEDDRARAGPRGVHDRGLRRLAGGDERRPAGDAAEARRVEERLDVRGRPPSAPASPSSGRRDLQAQLLAGRTAPASGMPPVEHDLEARAERRRARRATRRAQVGRADGERSGRAARAGDAAEVASAALASRPVVPGGRDDERVELAARPRPPARAARRRTRERLGDADQRDARRVVRVAVAVRVDRTLEAGEDLVGARVDGAAPGCVALPAGDADREDRRARRDAREAGRAARADEDAGELGSVPLELGLVVGVRRGEREVAPADDVDAVLDAAAQIGLRAVDARVEQRDRDASPVEARQRDVETGPLPGWKSRSRRSDDETRRGERRAHGVDALHLGRRSSSAIARGSSAAEKPLSTRA